MCRRCRADAHRLNGTGLVALDVEEFRAEQDVAAVCADALDDARDDLRQDVGADVGFCVPENLARRPRLDKRFDHKAMQGVLGACVEFAVGEGARPTQSKLDVRFQIELTGGVEALNRLGASAGVVAHLDEDGGEPRLRQREGGKEAGAPRADDDGPFSSVRLTLGANRAEGGPVHLDDAHAAAIAGANMLECGDLIACGGKLHARRQREVHIGFLARIDGLAMQGDAGDIRAGAAE